MTTEVKEIDGVLTAFLNGRLDTFSSQQCREDLEPLFANAGKKLVLDCANLEFISSSGLRVFVELVKKVGEEHGELSLQNLNDDVHNIFVIAGFAKRFNI